MRPLPAARWPRFSAAAAVGEFARALHTDLLDAAGWAMEQGYADAGRIGIMGGSYGGYAALVGVTVTPDYFAAAVDYVCVSDLANFLRMLPPFTRPHLVNNWYRYLGDPDDPTAEADMLARSPIPTVDRIRTPLLVAQGVNDVRVGQAECDNIVASLRARGVPVGHLLADDEGHGFENPRTRSACIARSRSTLPNTSEPADTPTFSSRTIEWPPARCIRVYPNATHIAPVSEGPIRGFGTCLG